MVNLVEESDEVISDLSKLVEDISSLYLNEKFSDVAFNIGGQKLHAHKVILAVRSQYFADSLYSDGQSEITISELSPDSFRTILKYIYTGTITISSNTVVCLEVLGLAHHFSLKNLELAISTKMKNSLNQENICAILNTANLHDLDDLRDACHSFMEKNASQIIANDCFTDLTQKSMINLLRRDTFYVPELEIFKSVSKWCKINNDIDGLVMQCVRLCWLSVAEIVTVVRPSKLLDCEHLFQAISEIIDVKPRTSRSRGILVMDENIATPENKAEVIWGFGREYLLTGNRDIEKVTSHTLYGNDNITIKLKAPSMFNHIHMMLWERFNRYFSYYIEVSVDKKKWLKVIDYSRCFCHSYQNLYFGTVTAQFIRISGTYNSAGPGFQLLFAEVYCKSNIPKIVQGIICPVTNVATWDKNTKVIEGERYNYLLKGETSYDMNVDWPYHTIGKGSIVIQLTQPYMISSMKLRLCDVDERTYKYYIETSVNKTDWEIAADRRNEACKSWQILNFKERAVVFVKITGTHNTYDGDFHCGYFECPASPDKN